MASEFGFRFICRVLTRALLLAICAESLLLAKRKDDVVIMKNGDRLTGKVKKLEGGVLYFEASYTLDSMSLDWSKVVRLESKDAYNIVLTDGKTYTGIVKKVPASGGAPPQLEISTGGRSVVVNENNVMRFSPSEESFWKQLTGSIDYGFSFSQGDSSPTSTLNASVEYRRERSWIYAGGSSVFSSSGGTNTNQLIVTYNRFISQNWFAGTLTQVLSSQEQDLNLRLTAGGAVGRYFVRTNRTSLSAIAGGALSNEHYTPGLTPPHTRHNDAQAVLGLDFETHRFNKLDLRSTFLAFPSLSTAGRLWVTSNSSVSIKMVHDLYWKINFYENYDTKPPIQAGKNDFSISTSFGWSF